MKKLTLLLLLFSISSFAQINFENGYFIKNDNSRVECLIKNIEWKNNPTEFEYKISNDETVRKAALADVKEFMVSDNQKFKRYKVDVDRSKNKFQDLGNEKEPVFVNETHFLRVLTEGSLNLYSYEETGRKLYFISSGNHEKAQQLVYKEYMVGTNNQILTNNAYKQQLSVLMADESFPTENFNNLTYKQNSILDLVVKYNTAKNPEIKNNLIRQTEGQFLFKIVAGANFATVDYDIIGIAGEIEQKTVLKIGAEIEYKFAHNKRKWSVFIEPNFQQYKSESKTHPLAIDYKFLEIPVGVRHYMFLGENDKSKIFVDAGYAYGASLSSSYGTPSQDIKVESSGNLFLGVGYNYSRYSIEFRYNFKRALEDFDGWDTSYKSSGITLGYQFL